ncbi:MAG: type IV pilus secretin PilQ [candidate division Zixibacteria bacterium]|nr:type IV pilus secretin PilQ [candidate division Zixibacteria bacterium]
MTLKTLRSSMLIAAALLLVFLSAPNVRAQDDPNAPIKNLSFQNADIRTVLGFLADYGQVNIVTSPEVQGNVTFSLKKVDWRQALDIVCKTYSLTAVDEAGYIRVTPTKSYLDEVSTMEKHKFDKEKMVELSTAVMKIDNATADELVKTVTPLLSERGKVQTDKRTNNLIVRDVPANITKIEKLITDLDKPTRQIRISAQMIEVSTTALQELGIDWTLKTSRTVSTKEKYETTSDQTLNDVTNPAGTFTFTTLQDGWNLTSRISALVSDGKGKIVAHPEVTTVDNKEARIQMGQKIPIKQFDQSGNVVITFEEVGSLLKVTPHITSENRILMQLKPERSSYEYDPNGVIINTSNAETNVVVENGQTAVIGGLTTQDEIENHVGLPILKDIPILGYLFSYKKKEITNRDLVIFVTPTIVEDYASTDKP